MRSFKRNLFGVMFASVLLAGSGAAPAFALKPWWHLSLSSRPAVLPPGGQDTIVVQAENVGDRVTSGAITLSDMLPADVTAQAVHFYLMGPGSNEDFASHCELQPSRVQCTDPDGEAGMPLVNPYEEIEMQIVVKVAASAVSGETNRVTVTGGEAPVASLTRPLTIEGGATPFGIDEFEMRPEEEGGGLDARAGSHPFQLSSTFNLNETAGLASPPALVRDLRFKLPAGLVGNATVLPRCGEQDFATESGAGINLCPENTVVGVAMVTIYIPAVSTVLTRPVPLFNLVPSRGEPARFGFALLHSLVMVDAAVRSGADYGVTVTTSNITQIVNLLATQVTFWGVPGDQRHDQSRGWGCIANQYWGGGLPCTPLDQKSPVPFLTLPTSCSSPFATSLEGDAWPTKADPEGLRFPAIEDPLLRGLGSGVGLTGCDQLPFSPSIEVAPDTGAASTATGLTVAVHIPQDGSANPNGLVESALKDTTVTLPEGVQVNPSSADGLQACSMGQVGYTGMEGGIAQFTPDAASCPDASKVGTVEEIKTPLLAEPLTGSIYLAAQNANPFGSLLALYIVAEDPVSGVRAKLAGNVALDPVTGRLTTTFDGAPQVPVEDIKLHFFGGSRAPLSTPASCGTYTTAASFTPWSGEPPVGSSSTFEINSGPNGAPCPGASLPFSPTLAAGMTNINAGAFSPLTTTLGREDGQQNISSAQLHMPPGLSGILSGVPLCPEAQANAGTCGQASLIGHTIVSVGLGNEPYSVTGGEVFLTEKVAGSPADAPFGLSIVNPAVAGPFDLGKVVVRATIEVDPNTAQLTVTTGQIPHILDGIPLQIKHVNVTIDRPGFTFNPTNCGKMQVTGSIGSVEGASSPVSVPFQVTNCASLKFAPKFTVSTSGKTSRLGGASLTAKLSYPKAAQGTYANIARVKVELPKQLPSRLTTLQKACTSAQFEVNPAGCPAASKIGSATVTTPLLPVPLSGPAIFVSHGGEAFPSLTMVLQGYGVTVDLVGTTFINKAGITSTTFKTVPDVPFNTFTLTLPEGQYSALAANGDLCKSKLTMPTEFLAQNGASIDQSTPIAVTGCARAKTLTRAQKLARALQRCHKQARAKRAACEGRAHKRYGAVRKANKRKRG